MQFIHNPLFWIGLGWIGSALTYALPDPSIQSSPLYVFTFRFFHALASNLDKLKLPKE
jgi:hypothetical protein